MRVCLYKGALKAVEKSGVGQAVFHQQEMLESVGIPVTSHLCGDTDVVHFNTVFPDSLLMSVIAKIFGKKIIYYGHSTMEDFRNSFKGSNRLAPLFRKWIKLCYGMGDVIVTPTDYSKKLLEGYGIQKPVVAMSNGVDTDFFRKDEKRREAFRQKYHLTAEDKAVVSVGHYIERKGILEYIHLAEELPDVKFFWFGYTNLNIVPDKIKEAVLTAPDNVIFPGYVEREELREAYSGCDLFAFMSHEETEGIVVLEALADEIPVLVRDIPVYDGWLEHEKNVYKAATDSQFSILARKMLAHEVPDLTAEGRETAKQRSIPEMGRRMCMLYQKLGKQEKQENC